MKLFYENGLRTGSEKMPQNDDPQPDSIENEITFWSLRRESFEGLFAQNPINFIQSFINYVLTFQILQDRVELSYLIDETL